MWPSSLGGGRILRRTLSVCPSVCLSVCLSVRPVIVTERHVAPPSELQWHTCSFRHALRAAYRTAISAAQILVLCAVICCVWPHTAAFGGWNQAQWKQLPACFIYSTPLQPVSLGYTWKANSSGMTPIQYTSYFPRHLIDTVRYTVTQYPSAQDRWSLYRWSTLQLNNRFPLWSSAFGKP